jgi:GxxExxY protein
MCIEFDDAGIGYLRQTRLPAPYKGRRLGEYRIDLIVEDLVIVEIKAVERQNPLFEAQILTYLRVTGKPLAC